MDDLRILAVAFVIGLLAANVYATYRIRRDELSERKQKVAQALLVWLLPIVGAIVVLYLQRNERFEVREYREAQENSDRITIDN